MTAKIMLLIACMLGPAVAFAQAPNPVLANASQVNDLEFPAKPSRLGFFTAPEMALYKPDGPGPFPAVVLHHQCGGLGQGNWQNVAILDWAKEAVRRGYVVLVIDSLSSRGGRPVCMGAQGGVTFPRGVRDAFQAAAHLHQFEFVDKERIALAGFSWGAMVAVFASRDTWAARLSPGPRFAAAVAFYPSCTPVRPPSGNAYEVVSTDIDRPLLVLMGEKDVETPPVECVPKLEAAKASAAPVEWHVYPDKTHCWDCRNLDGVSKVDIRGTHVVYHYDKNITSDSGRRMFEFFDKAFAVRR